MPDWKQYVRERLRLPALHAAREAEIVEDLAQQLDEAYRATLRRGVAEAEASETAQREIPDWERLAREITESESRNRRTLGQRALERVEHPQAKQGVIAMLASNWIADLLYSLRLLRKSPGFTLAAMLTLALGIGANAAVFSILNAVMLRPLPFPEPERLVRLWESNPQRGWPFFSASQPNFLDWRERNRSFERLAASSGWTFNLSGVDEPERISGLRVSHDFFPLLGAQPALGRNFLPEEDAAGASARVVLMTHGLWQRRFGADPAIVGKTVRLNELQYTVIGVLPQDFRWGANDLFIPLMADRNQNRSDHRLSVFGRLKTGVTLPQAHAEMEAVAGQLAQQYPDSNGGWTVRARSFYDWLIPEESRSAIYVLLGAVALVLLIACANVANLMLARATARRREIAIRTAMGASGARLVRQLLTESVLLAMLGGAAGLLFAYWGLELAGVTSGDTLPRADEISLDYRVLLFTLGVSLLTGILFGLAPALQASRTDLNETLKESGRSSAAAVRNRTRSVLVVTEVALSLVLLVGVGLLLRSFGELLQVQPGYNTQNLLTANISLPDGKYPTEKEFVAFHTQLLARLRALPGVQAASLASGIPMDRGGTSMEVHIQGRPTADGQQPSAQWRLVAPGYFEAMGIPLLAGRDLNQFDLAPGSRQLRGAVISEEMARRYWPNEDPVGRQFHPWATSNPPVTIVGVAGNVRMFGLEAEPDPVVYLNFAAGTWNPMTIVMRTESDPRGYANALRAEVRALDASLPLASIRTMDDLVERSLAPRRFNMTLLGIFGGVALVLAT
ncbi:MAG: ABC transporter permease, partial [Candidatus Acidiferrales bacterium]